MASGMKRTSPDLVCKGKRAKTIAGAKRRAAIISALSNANSIDEVTREMLCAVVPGCLSVPCGERNEIQKSMVKILEQALDEHMAVLQAVADNSKTKVDAIANEMRKNAANTEECLLNVEAKIQEVSTNIAKLKESETSVETCSAELDAARCTDKSLAAELREVGNQKDAFEKAAESFTILRGDDHPSDKRIAKKHITVVIKTLEDLVGLEEALAIGVPAAMCKPVAARKPFDERIFEYVSAMIAEETSKRSARVDGGAQEAVERADAVRVAKEALDAAIAARDARAQELAAAQQGKTDLETQLKASKAEDKKLSAKAAGAANENTASDTGLATFKEVCTYFATERDGEATQQEPDRKLVEEVLRDGEQPQHARIASAGA